MLKKTFSILIAVAAAGLAGAAQSWACSVCFTGTSDAVTDGFNASVLFLMSTPYLVVGSIVGALFFSCRRALRLHEQAEEGESEAPTAQLGWKQEESGR